MSLSLEVLCAIGGMIFGAGGIVMLLRVTSRDVNGLGRSVREEQARVAREHYRMAVLLLAICMEKDRRWLAEKLLHR